MNRSGLIAIQVAGALTILPYPFVILANIMSIAAPRQTLAGAIPWILLSAYPLVWIALYVFAWRAMARGAIALAFGLSSIPVMAGLCVIGLYAFSWIAFTRSYMGAKTEARNKMVKANPLMQAVYGTGGEKWYPPQKPSVTAEQAIRAIEENPAQVNIPVPPQGTPLKVAVENLMFNFDGSPIGDGRRQEDLMRVVRALVAHGAYFGQDERNDLKRAWLLRRALHEGPITTASENPLVWRILTRKRDGTTLFKLRKDEIPLLDTSTQLHGTPLYAALLQDGPDAYRELIEAGARLSPEEQRDTAAAGSLARVFEHDEDLRYAYRRARQ
jgi:hypothetical protein